MFCPQGCCQILLVPQHPGQGFLEVKEIGMWFTNKKYQYINILSGVEKRGVRKTTPLSHNKLEFSVQWGVHDRHKIISQVGQLWFASLKPLSMSPKIADTHYLKRWSEDVNVWEAGYQTDVNQWRMSIVWHNALCRPLSIVCTRINQLWYS